MRPRSVAVIGASARRHTGGNTVIANLVAAGAAPRVIPVHPSAETVDGLPAVGSIEDLRGQDCDCAVVSVPSARLAETVESLDRAGVGGAIVMTAGLSADEDRALRALAKRIAMPMHGPNCMGLINLADNVPLYSGGIPTRLRPGPVALVAQSGSAAISLMNSTDVGFSHVVTIGSEFRVTAADYMAWLAGEEATRAVGVVVESIQDAGRFAAAVDALAAAGKFLAVLRVGRSDVGALAVQAHTGAMIRDGDAYDCFFERHGVPTVDSYDELIACLECAVTLRPAPAGGRLGIVGVSGGETALACDLAEALGARLARFTPDTAAAIRAALPDCTGANPLDVGATVGEWGDDARARGILAVARDAGTDLVVHVHDLQDSLPPLTVGKYTAHLRSVLDIGATAAKPAVFVSPTSDRLNPDLAAMLSDAGVPVLRGLRPGLVASRNIGAWATRASVAQAKPRAPTDGIGALRDRLSRERGPLPDPLVRELLAAYDIPLVRSAVAHTADEAVALAPSVGFPLVVKVASRQIPHRSDIGAVVLGVHSAAELREAVAQIDDNVHRKAPGAVIDGYELQEQLVDGIEAMVGFKATPPFGALTLYGTGGTLVELEHDQALSLAPVASDEVAARLRGTKLGARLGGYRNLVPPTDLAGFAGLVARVSNLASELCDLLAEGDLNPVLIRKGSGEVRVVDALLVAAGGQS